MKLLKKLMCLVLGHRAQPTGRGGVALREWYCPRCDDFLMSHPEWPGVLLPSDQDAEDIMDEWRMR